jgi:hypothetical protein
MPDHASQQPQHITGFASPTSNNTQKPAANANTRLRWAESIGWTSPFLTHATSDPISISGCEPATPPSPHPERRRHLLPDLYEAEPRIHHRLDNVTDYCAPGFRGWEFAQQARAKREEANVGKILTGEWPPSEPWEREVVYRKDPDFSRGPSPKPERKENEDKESTERLLLQKWHAAEQLKKMKKTKSEERGNMP